MDSTTSRFIHENVGTKTLLGDVEGKIQVAIDQLVYCLLSEIFETLINKQASITESWYFSSLGYLTNDALMYLYKVDIQHVVDY